MRERPASATDVDYTPRRPSVKGGPVLAVQQRRGPHSRAPQLLTHRHLLAEILRLAALEIAALQYSSPCGVQCPAPSVLAGTLVQHDVVVAHALIAKLSAGPALSGPFSLPSTSIITPSAALLRQRLNQQVPNTSAVFSCYGNLILGLEAMRDYKLPHIRLLPELIH